MTSLDQAAFPERDEELEAKRAAIRVGVADLDAGRVVPHEEVRRWLLDLAAGRQAQRPRPACK
jgi:predicted transcriptional regulator